MNPLKNHKPSSISRPLAIDLFAGAGGLTIGLERAGFHTLAVTDFDKHCVEALGRNQAHKIPVASGSRRVHLAGASVIHADIHQLHKEDFGIPPGVEIDLVTGGPPCQPFSSAGAQRGLADSRGTLFQEFARLVSEIRPRFVLFENVRGLVTARGPSGRPGEALALVRQAFEDAGYATRCALLNAADFGAPQRRVRLFIIGSRVSTLPEFPSPTHGNMLGHLPWQTLGQFLNSFRGPADHEIVRPSAELERQLRKLPNGSGLKSPGVRETTRPGGHWGYKQGTFIADPNRPARTVTAASTQDWVRDDGKLRRLTIAECAALQGFPIEWEFTGSRAAQYRQIGNAVPAIFGEAIGHTLMQAVAQCKRGRHSAERVESAGLPEAFHQYVNYTIRDEARNGFDRPRSQRRDPESLEDKIA